MFKNIFTILILLIGITVSAQSSYQKSLDEKSQKINSAKTAADYDKLFNEFSALRKSQDPYKWKAYYYAALTMYKKAELVLAKNPKADERNTNGVAEKFVAGALALKQEDKESNDLLSLITDQKKKLELNTGK